jgi:hypothetical protein
VRIARQPEFRDSGVTMSNVCRNPRVVCAAMTHFRQLEPRALALTRRSWLMRSAATTALAGLAPAAWLAQPALAQPRGAEGKSLRVAQLLDTSGDQQELSRDYSTGVRLAFAEIK